METRLLPRCGEQRALGCDCLVGAMAGGGQRAVELDLETLCELVLSSARGTLERQSSSGGCTAQRVRERLALRYGQGSGCGSGEGGALEVLGGEVGDTVSDGRAELGEGLLYSGRIVVSLGLVYLGDPARSRGASVSYSVLR